MNCNNANDNKKKRSFFILHFNLAIKNPTTFICDIHCTDKTDFFTIFVYTIKDCSSKSYTYHLSHTIIMAETCSRFGSCLFYSANALARTITRIADEEFAATGLPSQYCFLLMIVIEKPSVQPKELSEKLSLTPSTVTRFVDKMEEQGYIIRTTDGKFTYITPTQKAKKKLPIIQEAWSKLYARYTAVLGKDNADSLAQTAFRAHSLLHES